MWRPGKDKCFSLAKEPYTPYPHDFPRANLTTYGCFYSDGQRDGRDYRARGRDAC